MTEPVTPKRWFRVVATVPAAAAEDAAAELAELGASGVKVDEGEPSRLETHFEKEIGDEAQRAIQPFDGTVVSAGWVEEEDWMETWKKRVPTLLVGRFCIHPSHEPPRDGLLNLQIDPGMAFGTGEHPTTRLMLLEMEALAASKPLGRFLDLGCGSGILAMAASLLGAKEVVAMDIDRKALDVARENAKANGLDGKIKFVEGSIGKAPGRYDEIVANLTSDVHRGKAKEYRRKLVPGGRMRLGGVQEAEAEDVQKATECVAARGGEGWVVLRSGEEAAWAATVEAPAPEPVKESATAKAEPPTLVLAPTPEIREPAKERKRGALHHLDLNVANLADSELFYARVLPRFGYEKGASGDGWTTFSCEGFYLTLVQATDPWREQGFHRKRVGVNHLAFSAPSKDAVDALYEWLVWEGIEVLYGGPMEMGEGEDIHYAVFFEDPDRLKLEYVFRP